MFNSRTVRVSKLSPRGRFPVVLVAVLAMVLPLATALSAKAAAPTILMTPSTPMASETVKVTGTLPGVYSRPVWVQRKSGTSWVTIAKGATSSKGLYSTSFKAPAAGLHSLRSLAPRVTIAGRVRAQYVTAASTLKVVGQYASVMVPATLAQGKTGTATIKFTPARTGRAVYLQVLKSNVWTTVASGKQSTAGAASLTFIAGAPGYPSYRAYTAAWSGAPLFISHTAVLKVVGMTAPGPVTALRATTVTPGSITLSWVNPTAAHFTGVTIRRAPGATAPASVSSGTAVPVPTSRTLTTFTDVGLAAGTQYSYAAFAHSSYNYAAAAKVTAKTSIKPVVVAPGPVTVLSAIPTSSGSIFLIWLNPSAANFTGVTIRRAVGPTPPASATSGTLVTETVGRSFTDVGLTAGTQYSYAAFAHGSSANYAAAAKVTVTTPR